MNDSLHRPVVAAFGEWSQSNIGDHAIHEGVQKFFRDCGWRVRSFDLGALRPASGMPTGSTTPAHADTRPRLRARVLDSLPVLKRALRHWRQRILMRRLMPKLTECDAICVGGGALLADSNLHFPQSLEVITDAARRLNKPLLCLGCSVEEDWSERGGRIVRDFLARCGFVAVRDRASATRVSRLLGCEVPVFGDFALIPDAACAPAKTRRRYSLAVNVTHVPAPHTHLQQAYEDGLVSVVTMAVEQAGAVGVILFTTGTSQDVAPALRVHARLASLGAELHLGRNLEQLRDILRSSRVVMAARLHAAIIALAEQLPVVGYAATPKIENFFRGVDLENRSFGPADPTVQVVNELMRILAPAQQQPGAPWRNAVAATHEAAREFMLGLRLLNVYARV